MLDAALDVGCDPVVSVSSMSVIFPPSGDEALAPTTRCTPEVAPYNASKADAELYARSLQDAGAPIVSLYPAGVIGPLDLGVNVIEGILAQILAAEYLLRADIGRQPLRRRARHGRGHRRARWCPAAARAATCPAGTS